MPAPSRYHGARAALCAAGAAWLVAATPMLGQPCPGDCDGNASTDATELARALRAVFDLEAADCAAANLDADGAVTAAEILRIHSAIAEPPDGCAAAATPTPPPTLTSTPPPTLTSTPPPTLTASPPPTLTTTPPPTLTTTLPPTVTPLPPSTPTRTRPPTLTPTRPPATPRSTWIPLTPLPDGERQEVAVAALDGDVYVVGGFTATGAGSSVVEVYDTGANRWRRAEDLPERRNHAGAAALDGALYVVGGFVGATFNPSAAVFRYDAATDQWSPRAPLPAPRGALAVAAVGGMLYASGGTGAGGSVTDHAVYDPAADEWTPRAPLPGARNHLAAVGLDGFLYVVGGRRDGGGNVNSAALHRYDPARDVWEARAPMPTARSGLAAAVLDGRIVVMGGEVNFDNPPTYVFPDVELYDPSTDRWIALAPMALPRHGIGAATVGDVIYVPGGATHAGFDAVAHADALRILD